jgi:hypothetical protein
VRDVCYLLRASRLMPQAAGCFVQLDILKVVLQFFLNAPSSLWQLKASRLMPQATGCFVPIDTVKILLEPFFNSIKDSNVVALINKPNGGLQLEACSQQPFFSNQSACGLQPYSPQ